MCRLSEAVQSKAFVILNLPSDRKVIRDKAISFFLYNIEPHFETKVVEKKCEGINQYEVLNAPLSDVILICGRAPILSSKKRSFAPVWKLIQTKEDYNA